MDAKTLEVLGATVRKVAVDYNRKVGDGDFGSIGASMSVEASLAAEADGDVAANALYEWCKAVVARNLQPDAVAARAAQKQAVQPPPEAPTSANPVPMPPPGTPESSEIEIVTLDGATCAHIFDQGEHRFKVFGGAWKKFGVPTYSEVLEHYKILGWDTWPVCKVGKNGAEAENRFSLPGGFQKVEVEVKDGKPLRVHSFK